MKMMEVKDGALDRSLGMFICPLSPAAPLTRSARNAAFSLLLAFAGTAPLTAG